MPSSDDMLKEIMEKVTLRLAGEIKKSINDTIEREFTQNFSRVLVESEFYKRIYSELQEGLCEIYQEISSANAENSPSVSVDRRETEQLFTETSSQLDAIISATEKATVEIMEVVEKQLDLQARSHDILQNLQENGVDKEQVSSLLEMNAALNQDLMNVMTVLSFQDITGQRIKRIITALKTVEKTVFDLYLSTGLKIKARQESPDKDLDQLDQEARQRVSDLKGPQEGVSQNDIDDLLANLGAGKQIPATRSS